MTKIMDNAMTPVEVVCAEAQEYHNVIAVCLDKDGNVRVHTSVQYPPDILWALMLAKEQLLDIGIEYDA